MFSKKKNICYIQVTRVYNILTDIMMIVGYIKFKFMYFQHAINIFLIETFSSF